MPRKKKFEPVEMPKQPEKEAEPKFQKQPNLLADTYFGVAEQTFASSPYVSDSQLRPYNPDDLFQKTGDYSIYEDMLNDDQVSICAKIKKDLVLANGWDIVVQETEGQDLEVKEFLEVALQEQTEGDFTEMLEEILTAYDFGFSITEKVFKKAEDGALYLRYLRTRHPGTWLIHTDARGAIERFEQRAESKSLDVDPKALIHYVNQPRFQNPYGTSDLRAAYNAWFAKRQIVRFFAIFMEKAASPTPIARYAKEAPAAAVDAIYNAIKSLQTKTAMAIPKEVEVEFLESKSAGDAYHKALNIFNMYIGRAMFIPDLMGFQGGETGGGSYSLGRDQIDVFFKHVGRRRWTLEQIVNRHIIKPLVEYNFGFMEKLPQFKLRAIREEDAVESAKLWVEAVKGKVFDPNPEEINHFRKLVKFPEGEVEEIEEPMPQAPAPTMGTEEPEQPEAPEAPEATEEEPKEDAEPEQKDFAKKSYDGTPGAYSKKVDFKVIETAMERFKNKVIDESSPVAKRIIEDIGAQIRKKKILQTQDAEKIADLSPKYLAELKTILKRAFRDANVDAKKMAERELMKGSYAQPLPDEKFMEVIAAEVDGFIDDLGINITRKARMQILAGMKDGLPLSTVLDQLDTDAFDDVITSMERFGRTKFTEVMNRGRVEFFNDLGVVAAYQYSAILDDRTTDICAGLHGKIFKAGTEPIPPMHWNCRSLLVPITKYEEWAADTKANNGKPIDKFIDDNKGDGFSRQ